MIKKLKKYWAGVEVKSSPFSGRKTHLQRPKLYKSLQWAKSEWKFLISSTIAVLAIIVTYLISSCP